MSDFETKLARLQSDLNHQAQRVQEIFLRAVESFFDQNFDGAQQVTEDDRVIDKVDVEIERASIPLLAMGVTDEYKIRSVLTIVKANNELERIADCAVNIAEIVGRCKDFDMPIPKTFRVMANSVVGMLRDTANALAQRDTRKAETVLEFDDTVDQFKREILLHAQEQIAAGTFTVQFAFRLHGVTKAIERVADHCTNICEQVIYLETGHVVRHEEAGVDLLDVLAVGGSNRRPIPLHDLALLILAVGFEA